MAETLVELVAKIKADSTELEKGLSSAERQTKASSKKMAESLKKIGVAMTAAGAAITAVMGLMGKAAIDEEINIKRLATTINNSGTAYDNVKDSLEAVIAATQRKTGVADDEQRNILNRLILVTNDYGKALGLLPTVLDLAAAGEMDATTAATYLGKAYLELEQGAESVSVRFGQASLQFKNMKDIQNRVAGSAENLANPLSVLKATLGDLAEAIGTNLIPIVKKAVDFIADITEGIIAWIQAHPSLVKALTIAATVVGLLAVGFGAATLAVIVFGTTMNLYLGGILILIGALVTGIVLLIDWFNRGSNAQKAALEKQKADDKAYFAQKRQLTETTYNKSIQKIREEYGIYESAQKNKMDLARDASVATRKDLADELTQARKVHDEKISMLDREYNEKIRTLNAEADYQVKAIQDQIDAIDAQTKAEDDANRIAFLQFQVSQAKTANERMAAQRELDNELILQQREAQKDSLRSQIDAIRQSTQTEEDRLKKELDKQTETYNTEFALLQTNIQLKDDALDGALERELRRLNDERIAVEKLEKDRLTFTLQRIDAESAIRQQMANIAGGKNFEGLSQRSIDIHRRLGTPGFASGGIVTQPTLAMIGESGAEAVIPLSEMDRNIQNNIYMDGALLAQVVSKYFDREYRAQLT